MLTVHLTQGWILRINTTVTLCVQGAPLWLSTHQQEDIWLTETCLAYQTGWGTVIESKGESWLSLSATQSLILTVDHAQKRWLLGTHPCA